MSGSRKNKYFSDTRAQTEYSAEQVAALKDQLKNQEIEITSLKIENDNLKKGLQKFESEQDYYQKEMNRLKTQNYELESALNNLKADQPIIKLRNKIKQLEEDLKLIEKENNILKEEASEDAKRHREELAKEKRKIKEIKETEKLLRKMIEDSKKEKAEEIKDLVITQEKEKKKLKLTNMKLLKDQILEETPPLIIIQNDSNEENRIVDEDDRIVDEVPQIVEQQDEAAALIDENIEISSENNNKASRGRPRRVLRGEKKISYHEDDTGSISTSGNESESQKGKKAAIKKTKVAGSKKTLSKRVAEKKSQQVIDVNLLQAARNVDTDSEDSASSAGSGRGSRNRYLGLTDHFSDTKGDLEDIKEGSLKVDKTILPFTFPITDLKTFLELEKKLTEDSTAKEAKLHYIRKIISIHSDTGNTKWNTVNTLKGIIHKEVGKKCSLTGQRSGRSSGATAIGKFAAIQIMTGVLHGLSTDGTTAAEILNVHIKSFLNSSNTQRKK